MTPFLRGAMVCVDYADLLAVTLPANRRHFAEMLIVTTPDDYATLQLAAEYGCRTHVTRAFYEDGADFNKWRAFEEGLNSYGRHGWMCLMDADVIWPAEPDFDTLRIGCLHGPYRRIFPDVTADVPPESCWYNYRRHPNIREIAGYTQIFHGDDRHLPTPPWHDLNWRHAGCADSFFQHRWSWDDGSKIRLEWDVLHLGDHGLNWCGRSTRMRDGSVPEDSANKKKALHDYKRTRRRVTGRGTIYDDVDFSGERLPDVPPR